MGWPSLWLSSKESTCIQDLQKMQVPPLGLEVPLEENMAPHSSILAWRIPMNRGALLATVSGVAKNWTLLSDKAQMFLF